MKIAIAQLNYIIGNFEYNFNKIIEAIESAEHEGADLVVFSELAICGYPPKDLLDYPDFVDDCIEYAEKLAPFSKRIGVIVGGPSRNPVVEGKDIFNSAWFLYEGEVKQVVNKTLLPTYDVFDEYRYFENNDQFNLLHFKGHNIALTICEDLWNVDENPMYEYSPMDELVALGADFCINIAASPFSYNHADERKNVLRANVARYKLPTLYVNQVGSNTEVIFDGGSMMLDAGGRLVAELRYFAEDLRIIDTDAPYSYTIKRSFEKPELIHDALVLGIQDYFAKTGFKKAVIGASGGIDSAVVQALACEALGSENVVGMMMPSRYSSEGSVDDAIKLSELLGCSSHIIPINGIVEAYEQALSEVFQGTKPDITEENIQSRARAILLMAYSNKFGHLLLNTSNKSELAVGYGTLYGDMCGGLSVIGDVYKTDVYDLAAYINRDKEVIPYAIIEKEPSAELRPGQKDSDSLPPYHILDAILFRYIEEWHSLKRIIAEGFDPATVRKTISMVNRNEYKRHQAPPVLRVSSKAFGAGRRIPLVAKYNF